MMFTLLICQILLAATFFFAAITKLRHHDAFITALVNSKLPSWLARFTHLVIPPLEFVIAALILFSTSVLLTTATVGASALLIVFTGWIIWVRVRGISLSCRCFGKPSPIVGWRTILRNCVLLSISILGIFLSGFTPSLLSTLPRGALISVAGVICISYVVYILFIYKARFLLNLLSVPSSGREVLRHSFMRPNILSRRNFIRHITVGTSLILGILNVDPALASPSKCPQSRRCDCYPDTYTATVCNYDCARFPNSYCYGPVYYFTAKNCCEPDDPVECAVIQGAATGYLAFCQYCPPACTC